MQNPPIAVIFDTNSYRYLVAEKTTADVHQEVAAMRALEATKNIEAYGVLIVGMEMLAHLADPPGSSNYTACYNGVIAMAEHCWDDSRNMARIIPQPYLHLALSYFNTIPQQLEDQVKNMAGVINDFKVDPVASLAFHHTNSSFINIKGFIATQEALFASQIMLMIETAKVEVKKQYPRANTNHFRAKLLEFIKDGPYEPILALAVISAVAQSVCATLTTDELFDCAMRLNLEMPLSVGFYRWISYKIVEGPINMQSKSSQQKRWNWQWDQQVAFLISDHTINGRQTILVTADVDIRDILTDHGFSARVMTLPEYQTFLNS